MILKFYRLTPSGSFGEFLGAYPERTIANAKNANIMNRKTMRFVFGIMFSVSGRITFLLLRFLKSLFPLIIFRTKDPIRVPINSIIVGIQCSRKIASSCLSWMLFYSEVTTLVMIQIKSFDFPRFRSSLETKSFFSSYPLS